MKQAFDNLKRFDQVVVEALGPEAGARFLAPDVDEDEAMALAGQILERYPTLVREAPPLIVDGCERHVVLVEQTSIDTAYVMDEDSGTYRLSYDEHGQPRLLPFSAPIQERMNH